MGRKGSVGRARLLGRLTSVGGQEKESRLELQASGMQAVDP